MSVALVRLAEEMSLRKSIVAAFAALIIIAPRADAGGFLRGLRFEAGYVHVSLQPGDFSDGMIRIGTDKWFRSIDEASGIEAGVGYAASSRLTVGLRTGYAFGSNEIPIKFCLNPHDFSDCVDSELECRIADVPLVLTLDYRATRADWATAIELAGEMHFVEFSSRTPEIESLGMDARKTVLGEETTFGAHAALAVEWSPGSKLLLGARAGYRVTETMQLEGFSLELGGWFLGLFIGLRPWA